MSCCSDDGREETLHIQVQNERPFTFKFPRRLFLFQGVELDYIDSDDVIVGGKRWVGIAETLIITSFPQSELLIHELHPWLDDRLQSCATK